MRRRKVLTALCGTSLLGSIALGSGSFSQTSADRTVAVDVVGDEDAYLALRYPRSVSAGCGATVTLTVANHTTTELNALDIELAFDSSKAAIDGIEPSDDAFDVEDGQTVSLGSAAAFAAGDSVVLDITLSGFEGHGSAQLLFDVAAGGETDPVSIETTSSRAVAIDYACRVGPSGCPVHIRSVSPDPAADAADGLARASDIALTSDVDGSVRTTEGNDGDIAINGDPDDPVQVAGDVEADGEISSLTDAGVGGRIVAAGGDIDGVRGRTRIGGDVTTTDGSSGDIAINGSPDGRIQVTGRVRADGEISGLTDADIGGDVVANGDIGGAVERARIDGDVRTATGSDGDVAIERSTVCGAVEADGAVGALASSEVSGSVSAGSDIAVSHDTTVFGTVAAGGDVTIKSGTEVRDGVADGNDVTVVDSTVRGNISARGDVDIGPNGIVGGDVDAGGDVTVGSDSVVEGDVSAGGEVSGSGTIEGRDPRDS